MLEELVIEKWQKKPMIKPRIEKVTVNISVGKSGESLERAAKIIEQITGQKHCKRKAKKTIREFGIRRGEPIACLVTLRKERADNLLKKAFQAIDNRLPLKCFDRHGNFSFGIKEHIEIPGTKYVPELGIYGMDVSVGVGRSGYRIKRRRRASSKVGPRHLLTPEEAKLFIKDKFGVEVIEGSL